MTKKAFAWALAGTAALVVLLAVGVMLFFGVGWFSQHTANFRGQTSVKNQVNGNGSYRIAAYDHFFNLCQQVQSDEQSISNLTAEQKTTRDPQRTIVLAASITALRNSRADAITQYNADARKTWTLGQFRDSNLPYQLDLTNEETSCHA